MKTYFHGSMEFAKTLKLRLRVGSLDPPKRRKRYRYTGTSSREEEEINAHVYPCGKAIESRTHIPGIIVGKCAMHKEERDVLEQKMRERNECDTEAFGTLPPPLEIAARKRSLSHC